MYGMMTGTISSGVLLYARSIRIQDAGCEQYVDRQFFAILIGALMFF